MVLLVVHVDVLSTLWGSFDLSYDAVDFCERSSLEVLRNLDELVDLVESGKGILVVSDLSADVLCRIGDYESVGQHEQMVGIVHLDINRLSLFGKQSETEQRIGRNSIVSEHCSMDRKVLWKLTYRNRSAKCQYLMVPGRDQVQIVPAAPEHETPQMPVAAYDDIQYPGRSCTSFAVCSQHLVSGHDVLYRLYRPVGHSHFRVRIKTKRQFLCHWLAHHCRRIKRHKRVQSGKLSVRTQTCTFLADAMRNTTGDRRTDKNLLLSDLLRVIRSKQRSGLQVS